MTTNFSPPFLAGPIDLPILPWQQAPWLGTETPAGICSKPLSAEPQRVPPNLVLQAAMTSSSASSLPTSSMTV